MNSHKYFSYAVLLWYAVDWVLCCSIAFYALSFQDNSQSITLVGATLETLLKFLNWIPLGYIFETKLVTTLIYRVSFCCVASMLPHAPCYPMSHVTPCCPMLPHAPCYPMPHVTPCPMLPHAPCYPMPHVTPCPMLPHAPCYPMPHVTPCPMLPHAPCCPMLPHVTPCCPMLPHAAPCYPMPHVTPCCPMLQFLTVPAFRNVTLKCLTEIGWWCFGWSLGRW